MVDYDWILKILHKNSSIEVCESLYTRNVKKDNLSLERNYRKNDFEITHKAIEKVFSIISKKINYRNKKIT